ncbi:MAG: virulence RhuM family protein [Planctomycetota bacterium]
MSDNVLALPGDSGQFLFYQTDDGETRVEVRLLRETVWLSLNQMADLFQRDKSVISKHISNAFEEAELRPEATVAKFATVQSEGTRQVTREIEYYNLDVIISVGYRVKSLRGTQFRIWATQRLREYIVKGFTMDDERLKRSGGGGYFDELLARIRDIRSSEKVFWRKVLDIYATSLDYDPNSAMSQRFFATVQNKMHWAAHGHTAAEIIAARADAAKPNMGLTSWLGPKPRKADAGVAKNYLSKDEVEALNLIVSFYLDFAELQARGRRPMHMRDWISKLDDFLRLSERQILTHAGNISHGAAQAKAAAEYEKFRALQASQPSPVEKHFDEALQKLKQLEHRPPAPEKPETDSAPPPEPKKKGRRAKPGA